MGGKKMRAPVAEIFYSCQMEGPNIGKPSVFVRFWGCNLKCAFDGKSCDTPYATITGRSKAKKMRTQDIIAEIKKYKSNHIVFTGGEPLIYQLHIVRIMEQLYPIYTAEVETNATIPITQTLSKLIDQFNLSVKLKSSNQTIGFNEKRVNNNAIGSFPTYKSVFKFVVSNKYDIDEINSIAKEFPKIKVYLMPQGTTREEIIKNSSKVVDLCLKHNYNFSPREHIIIWGGKRGV
jgi:7-carboxy-7-deazaguanine synthase